MGNITSTQLNIPKTEFDNFYNIIDYIATYYILTMDFKSLSKLSEKEYCDKLVILTSDIIEQNFNDIEITYLSQRIKDGVEVNNLKTEKFSFINKDSLEKIDVSNDLQKNIKKKRVCIGIAKFYIKIAHIFSAIVMTVNPVYTYKDSSGTIVKTKLLDKDKIPKGVNRKLYKLNICDNRIRALKRKEVINNETDSVTIQPKICDMNKTKTGFIKTLNEEPGIPELMKLYLDDNYDYSNGNFTGMSETTKPQFLKDLKLFYTTFTGNQSMPPEITKFSDIKLRDYSKTPSCKNDSQFQMPFSLNKKDKLFIAYATNIKKMIQTAADNQSKLLSVINELFTFVIDPYSKKKVIRINPKLTDETLQKAVENSRKFIIDLYIKCESDYVNGIKIYEAIVESKLVETTINQTYKLEKELSNLLNETKQLTQPMKEEQMKPNPTITSERFLTEERYSTPPSTSVFIPSPLQTPLSLNTSSSPLPLNSSSSPLTLNTSSTPLPLNTSSSPLPLNSSSSPLPLNSSSSPLPLNSSSTPLTNYSFNSLIHSTETTNSPL